MRNSINSFKQKKRNGKTVHRINRGVTKAIRLRGTQHRIKTARQNQICVREQLDKHS
jgi:hypothetical protein